MGEGDEALVRSADREKLLDELRRLQEELEDVKEEERAWFLQTGQHIGRRAFQERRRELATDRKRLEESIRQVQQLLDL